VSNFKLVLEKDWKNVPVYLIGMYRPTNQTNLGIIPELFPDLMPHTKVCSRMEREHTLALRAWMVLFGAILPFGFVWKRFLATVCVTEWIVNHHFIKRKKNLEQTRWYLGTLKRGFYSHCIRSSHKHRRFFWIIS